VADEEGYYTVPNSVDAARALTEYTPPVRDGDTQADTFSPGDGIVATRSQSQSQSPSHTADAGGQPSRPHPSTNHS